MQACFRLRGFWTLARLSFLGVAATATVGVAQAGAQTLEVGIVAPGPTYWPLYIGQDIGVFDKAGVKLDVISSGSTTAQQLVAGAIDVGCSGFPDFMRATANGGAVKIYADAIAAPPYDVYAKPQIKTVAQLKGKTISIGDVHDVTLIYVTKLLATAGLKPTDVDFVYAKSAGDRFRALASGAVDAAIINPPSNFKAAALGLSKIGDISKLMPSFPFTVWATNTSWSAGHAAALAKFDQAYLRATAWLYDPANEKRAVEILTRLARVDPKDAQSSYDYLVRDLHAFSTDGKLDQTGFQQMSDALVRLGDIKPPVPGLDSFYARPQGG